MQLKPLRPSQPVRPASTGASSPAPVGGWNARDSVAAMPVQDALILENWFPGTSNVRVRRGHEEHATGLPSTVETLMAYASGGTEELWGVSGGEIHEVSSSGAVGAAAVSSLTNSRWQHVNFGTSGGNFLFCVNGADDPRNYDGTSWDTSPAITGVTAANLVHVNAFKRRLFLIENNKLTFWYLSVDSIGGSATEFDLAPLCSLGGHLMAMGTWTRDGGDGLDDLAVFYTSNGEVIVYQGSDPGDASDWALVGVFRLGAPVGRRCMMKVGPDLVLITQDGFIPMSKALRSARTNERVALSDKIRDAVNQAVRTHGGNFGWQGILYPKGSWALFNVPIQEGGTTEQYVANTTTGAWCRFTGMNASCWEVFNDDLYFGGNQTVYKADSGLDDDGANIETDVQQAPSYMGQRGLLKRFTMVRPVLVTDGSVGLALTVNVDFEDTLPVSAPTFSVNTQSPWNTSPWNTTPWTKGLAIVKSWQSVSGVGYAASIRMQTQSTGLELFWNSTDWVFEPGGML